MQLVQYSRIYHRRVSLLFSHLFIRDCRVIASGLLVFLVVCSATITNTVAEKSAEITLQTCCPFQSQYDENDGTCVSVHHEDDDATMALIHNNAFPGTLELPEHLISRPYHNRAGNRTFRLKPQMISCPNGTIVVNVSLSQPEVWPSDRRNMNNTVFTPVNGYMRHYLDVFYPDEYCFNKMDENELEIMICQPDCSEERPCVPKCCEIGQVWDLTEYPDGPARCAFAGETQWQPQIYSKVREKIPLDNVRPHIYISHPRGFCVEDSTIHRLKPFMDEMKRPFRILQSGEIWYKFDRLTWHAFTKDTYCVDGSFVKPSAEDTGEYSGRYEDTVVWDCGPPLVAPVTTGTSELYAISMLIAAFFLLLTVICYILLWDKQNVHSDSSGGGTTCYIIGICAHFFFLSSFSFMTCVNFDLWLTFRILLPTSGKSKGIKKFLMYNLFALGIPMIIVVVGIILDTLYKDDPDSYVIVPLYGVRTCYMDMNAALPYAQGPAGFLLSCNLIFFTVTLYQISQIQKSTKFATMSSSKNAKQKQAMFLFAKLFLVMGIPWVLEVISSTMHEVLQSNEVVPFYFQIIDMINIFQGVVIFIIFVLKKEILNSLENKFPAFRRFILAITIRPEQADSILRRHPRLRFIINPLTRSITSTRSFSTAKTTLSNGTEGSTSSRANVLGRTSDPLDRSLTPTSSSSAHSSPSGSLTGKRVEVLDTTEILELR